MLELECLKCFKESLPKQTLIRFFESCPSLLQSVFGIDKVSLPVFDVTSGTALTTRNILDRLRPSLKNYALDYFSDHTLTEASQLIDSTKDEGDETHFSLLYLMSECTSNSDDEFHLFSTFLEKFESILPSCDWNSFEQNLQHLKGTSVKLKQHYSTFQEKRFGSKKLFGLKSKCFNKKNDFVDLKLLLFEIQLLIDVSGREVRITVLSYLILMKDRLGMKLFENPQVFTHETGKVSTLNKLMLVERNRPLCSSDFSTGYSKKLAVALVNYIIIDNKSVIDHTLLHILDSFELSLSLKKEMKYSGIFDKVHKYFKTIFEDSLCSIQQKKKLVNVFVYKYVEKDFAVMKKKGNYGAKNDGNIEFDNYSIYHFENGYFASAQIAYFINFRFVLRTLINILICDFMLNKKPLYAVTFISSSTVQSTYF